MCFSFFQTIRVLKIAKIQSKDRWFFAKIQTERVDLLFRPLFVIFVSQKKQTTN
jgi:hypothetical protein